MIERAMRSQYAYPMSYDILDACHREEVGPLAGAKRHPRPSSPAAAYAYTHAALHAGSTHACTGEPCCDRSQPQQHSAQVNGVSARPLRRCAAASTPKSAAKKAAGEWHCIALRTPSLPAGASTRITQTTICITQTPICWLLEARAVEEANAAGPGGGRECAQGRAKSCTAHSGRQERPKRRWST